MSKLNWGILSTGRISDWFCGDMRLTDAGNIAAVCSRSMENAEKFAADYDIPRAYDDYKAMLNDDTVDVVYIGTPHTLHHPNAIDAMRAGKHVLCEKPITTNEDEAKELAQIAKDNGVFLMEAVWTYFLPAMQKAKEWVRAGRIGEIKHIKTDFGYPVPYSPDQREWDVSLGGGVLLEMGIYPIAITHFFTEVDPLKMFATASFAPNGVERDVTMVFNFENCVASLGTSFDCRLRNAAHIVGTDGYIVIPNAFRASECSLFQIDDLIDHFEAPREARGYHYQAISMTEDILAGRSQSAIAPLSASITLQRQIDAVRQILQDS